MSTYKKIFSLALLLSVVAAGQPSLQARNSSCGRDCETSCDTSRDCSTDCSTDCSDDCSRDCSADCGFGHGRTHFSPRSITFDSAYELALTNYHVYHSNNFCGPRSSVALYFTPFFQKTTKNRRHERFFQTTSQSELVNGNEGRFSRENRVRPERKVYGSLFTLYADLACLCDGTWLSINTAAVGVEHKLRSCGNREECCVDNYFDVLDVNSTIPCDTDIPCDFGRRCSRKRGLDDIQVKLGYDYFMCSNDHVGLYLVAGIPTGRKHRGEFFDALIGTRHGSLGFGINGDYTICQGGQSDLVFMADFKYRYVFAAKERRILDINRESCEEIRECVKVKPRSTIDFWAALHYQYCNWGLELGYDLFWRQSEKICPSRLDVCGQDTCCDTNDTVSSACDANINDEFNFNARSCETACDTGLRSDSGLRTHAAAHSRVLNHKVYLGLGYNTTVCNYPTLLGLVASYEASRCRGTFANWAVYGKIGVQF